MCRVIWNSGQLPVQHTSRFLDVVVNCWKETGWDLSVIWSGKRKIACFGASCPFLPLVSEKKIFFSGLEKIEAPKTLIVNKKWFFSVQGLSVQYTSEKPDLRNYRWILIARIRMRIDYSVLYSKMFDIGLFRNVLVANNTNLA